MLDLILKLFSFSEIEKLITDNYLTNFTAGFIAFGNSVSYWFTDKLRFSQNVL